jgi:hypothetical protein
MLEAGLFVRSIAPICDSVRGGSLAQTELRAAIMEYPGARVGVAVWERAKGHPSASEGYLAEMTQILPRRSVRGILWCSGRAIGAQGKAVAKQAMRRISSPRLMKARAVAAMSCVILDRHRCPRK